MVAVIAVGALIVVSLASLGAARAYFKGSQASISPEPLSLYALHDDPANAMGTIPSSATTETAPHNAAIPAS